MQTDIFINIQLAKNGDRNAQSKIIEENTGLVWSVVKRYLGRGHEAEDLYQIGCIGLIKAMQKFDTGYNVRFSTYAVPMIMGEIRRHLRDDGMIKVSRRLKELGFRAKAVQESLLTTLHREPTVNEVASAMGIEAVELTMAIEALQAPESLCDVSGSEDSRELIEKVEDCSET